MKVADSARSWRGITQQGWCSSYHSLRWRHRCAGQSGCLRSYRAGEAVRVQTPVYTHWVIAGQLLCTTFNGGHMVARAFVSIFCMTRVVQRTMPTRSAKPQPYRHQTGEMGEALQVDYTHAENPY